MKNYELSVVLKELKIERTNRNFLQEKYENMEVINEKMVNEEIEKNNIIEYQDEEIRRLNQINVDMNNEYLKTEEGINDIHKLNEKQLIEKLKEMNEQNAKLTEEKNNLMGKNKIFQVSPNEESIFFIIFL